MYFIRDKYSRLDEVRQRLTFCFWGCCYIPELWRMLDGNCVLTPQSVLWEEVWTWLTAFGFNVFHDTDLIHPIKHCPAIVYLAVPWHRWLDFVARVYEGKGFDPRAVHMAFVVDNVKLGHIFLGTLQFSPFIIILPLFRTHLFLCHWLFVIIYWQQRFYATFNINNYCLPLWIMSSIKIYVLCSPDVYVGVVLA